MSDLTREERQILDAVRFDERSKLRTDTWVVPGPFTERAAAGALDWYVPTLPEVAAKWAAPANVPDVARVKPFLVHLVELGKLVVLGEVTFPYFPEAEGEVYHEYATPGFSARFEKLWGDRRDETWKEAHPNVSIFPGPKR